MCTSSSSKLSSTTLKLNDSDIHSEMVPIFVNIKNRLAKKVKEVGQWLWLSW